MNATLNIHPNDEMFHGNFEHYRDCGKQIADMLEIYVPLLKPGNVILELPCGFGRATRHIASRFLATLHVADIQSDAVDFCVENFECVGHVISEPALEFLSIPNDFFDVAVMGSLITHLGFNDTKTIVTNFAKKLKYEGVAIITTHGERAYDLLKANPIYDIEDKDRKLLIDAYESGAYGFCMYKQDTSFERITKECAGENRYGISLTPRALNEVIFREAGLEVIKYEKGFWDNHQDVFWLKKK